MIVIRFIGWKNNKRTELTSVQRSNGTRVLKRFEATVRTKLSTIFEKVTRQLL